MGKEQQGRNEENQRKMRNQILEPGSRFFFFFPLGVSLMSLENGGGRRRGGPQGVELHTQKRRGQQNMDCLGNPRPRSRGEGKKKMGREREQEKNYYGGADEGNL